MSDLHGEQMRAILKRVAARFGSPELALNWYQREPLPGFSGKTAEALTAQGRYLDVLEFLDAVDAGLHA